MEQLILRQFQQLPANLQQEVLDFIGYLLTKHQLNGSKTTGPIQKPSRENASSQKSNDLANAILIVRQGCDMTAFGDALQYQIEARV